MKTAADRKMIHSNAAIDGSNQSLNPHTVTIQITMANQVYGVLRMSDLTDLDAT